jgi:hypothetical protein
LEKLPIGERKSLVSSDYLTILKEFQSRFKFWKPGIYIFVEGGNVQGASANCDMDFSLFDNDNEKVRTELEPGEEPYNERLDMWNWMIDSGHNDGSLKEIY